MMFALKSFKLPGNYVKIMHKCSCFHIVLLFCIICLCFHKLSYHKYCENYHSHGHARGVHDRVVRYADLYILAPHLCAFKSSQDHLDSSCEGAIQLVDRTSVILPRCQLVPEIIHGRAHEVQR